MIVTIDGPCGSGKSTVARELALQLGFEHLDTGAMYRTVTWKSLKSGVDLQKEPESIIDIARNIRIDFESSKDTVRVFCDGCEVTCEIRTPEVTRLIKYVADQPPVREEMVKLQRRFAKRVRNVVTEGRDQGSVVFPDADVKFFLDADVRERARRRMKDYVSSGFEGDFNDVIEDIRERDKADKQRPVGALKCTDSMIIIDSTGLKINEVIDKMVHYINAVKFE